MSCNCDGNPLILPIGPPGINGTNGVDGKDGKDGANGAPGIPGINGTNGTNGVSGYKGMHFIYNYNNRAEGPGSESDDIYLGYFRFPGTGTFPNTITVKAVVQAYQSTGLTPLSDKIIVSLLRYDGEGSSTILAQYEGLPPGTVQGINPPTKKIITLTNRAAPIIFPISEAILFVSVQVVGNGDNWVVIHSLDLT